MRIRIDAEALLGSAERREGEISRAVEETLAYLSAPRRPRAVVLETASASRQLSEADEARRDFVHAASGMVPVNDALGEILLRTLQQDAQKNVRGLYVSGGDTMVSVLSHMDARCVSVLGYIIPQVDICRLVGGRFDGMTVVSKGGLTGDTQIANMIVGRILREAAKEA